MKDQRTNHMCLRISSDVNNE